MWYTSAMEETRRQRLVELAAIYFRIGATAFGGPAAQLAMFEEELVKRRAWVERQRFLDFLGASSIIPGPSATQVGLYLAQSRAGLAGLVVGALAFIGPAALITAVLTWAFLRWGQLPGVGAPVLGIKAAILAVIAAAIGRLARGAVKGWLTGAYLVAALGSHALGVPELVVLLGTGLVGAALTASRQGGRAPGWALVGGLVGGMGAGAATAGTPATLFWWFFQVGAVMFGGGYVLIAFLEGGVVQQMGWLAPSQLMDAIAIGQITPGPLYTIATSVGFMVAGWTGAFAATAGIFLPGIVWVAATGPLVHRMRGSALAAGFLDAVNAAAVGLMLAVLVPLTRDSLGGWVGIVIAAVAAAVHLGARQSALRVVMLGAVLGGLADRSGLL